MDQREISISLRLSPLMRTRQSLDGTAYGSFSSIVKRQLSGKLNDNLLYLRVIQQQEPLQP
jgi:hypothetical protein